MKLLLSVIALLFVWLSLRFLRLRYVSAFTRGWKYYLNPFLLITEGLLGTISGWLLIGLLFKDNYYAGMLRSAYVLLLLVLFAWLYGKDLLAGFILRLEGKLKQGGYIRVGNIEGELVKQQTGAIYVRDAQGWIHKIPCSKLLLGGLGWKEENTIHGSYVTLTLPLLTPQTPQEKERLSRLVGDYLMQSPWVKTHRHHTMEWQNGRLQLRVALIDKEAHEFVREELMHLLQQFHHGNK
ncbi:MAG: hypothetical protein KatS3mg033_0606 [Thermonema sp.]|jgi:hypothetical protein|uniref:mechanosensitive ion channel domain-containing protein n=1 Tax=Thermonema sp. TaxID=2231181 RepID=UPI0021DC1B4F|nr:mechanosensitive ion channel domain-containing protein [Thermonema sp.]GIV38806.1 MAG: hypothetical protein KatS3mg033_0606 [Thermonema sp.]